MSEFKGVAYPIQKDPHGYFRNTDSMNQIKSDLLILLLTYPGERVMLPEFGTPLRDLLFDPNDAALAFRAQDMIARSISLWEPRISVDQIEVVIQPDGHQVGIPGDRSVQPHVLLIRIVFKEFENIKDVQVLELAVPLTSAQ